MFYICGAITLFGGVFWALFCEGDLQPWACEESGKNRKESDNSGAQTTSL